MRQSGGCGGKQKEAGAASAALLGVFFALATALEPAPASSIALRDRDLDQDAGHGTEATGSFNAITDTP